MKRKLYWPSLIALCLILLLGTIVGTGAWYSHNLRVASQMNMKIQARSLKVKNLQVYGRASTSDPYLLLEEDPYVMRTFQPPYNGNANSDTYELLIAVKLEQFPVDAQAVSATFLRNDSPGNVTSSLVSLSFAEDQTNIADLHFEEDPLSPELAADRSSFLDALNFHDTTTFSQGDITFSHTLSSAERDNGMILFFRMDYDPELTAYEIASVSRIERFDTSTGDIRTSDMSKEIQYLSDFSSILFEIP